MEKIPEVIHESWHEFLKPLFNDDRMKSIKYNLLPSCNFQPESKDVFRVFSMPLNKIQVVILGQDPYPTPGVANGLAFAVNRGAKTPVSLNLIRQEVVHSVHWTLVQGSEWDTLESWTKQGIFLLNTALTVEDYNSGRHLKHWRWFTEEVVKIISKEYDYHGLIYVWGNKIAMFSFAKDLTAVVLESEELAKIAWQYK